MSQSNTRVPHPPAAQPGQAWNTHAAVWGPSFLISAIAYFGFLQVTNYLAGFMPFGGMVAFIIGVPVGALLFKYAFTTATGGIQPTMKQGELAVALAVGLPICDLAVPVTLALDDAASPALLVMVGLALLALNVVWGVIAMHLWKKPGAVSLAQ